MKRRFLTIFLAGGFALCLSQCGKRDDDSTEVGKSETAEETEVEAKDWPLFRGNAEMHGVSEEDLKPPLELAWVYKPIVASGEGDDEDNKTAANDPKTGKKLPKTNFPIEASPVVANGVVYVGGQDSRFFAIDLKDGTEKWTFWAEGGITAPAAVFGNRVFMADTYGFVYVIDSGTGEEIWRFEAGDKIEGGINALDINGNLILFVGSHDTMLYALDPVRKTKVWEYETGGPIVATPAIDESKPSIMFGGCDGIFHIVSGHGGGKLGEVEIGGYIASTSPVRDGICYVAANGGDVLAIDLESGEEVWKVATKNEFIASPAVNEKHMIVAGPDKRLVAYDRVTGDEVWAFSATRSIDGSPVACDSAIWFGGMDGRLYAVDPETGEELWNYELGVQMKSSPAISGQTLVVCGDDGFIYAFRPQVKP